MITIIAQSFRIARLISFVLQADIENEGYFANDKYFITWTYGHMVELETPRGNPGYWFHNSSFPVIPEQTTLAPAPSRRVNERGAPDPQLNVIKGLLGKSKSVLLALDPTMNGDLIGGYLLSYLGYTGKVTRIVLNDLMNSSIKNAIYFPVPVEDYDDRYRKAALLDESDWLINVNCSRSFAFASGMNTYPFLRGAMPILDAIVRREHEVMEPKIDQWSIPTICVKDNEGETISLPCTKMFSNLPQKVSEALKAGTCATVTKYKIRNVVVSQPKLHSILSLQMDAATTFGMDPAQTYKVARSLYEKKRISFPSPSSEGITRREFDAFKEEVYPMMLQAKSFASIIPEGYKPSYTKAAKNDSSTAHGIILTSFRFLALSDDECKVMYLIGRRMLRTFAKTTKAKIATLEITCNGYKFETEYSLVSRKGHRDFIKSRESNTATFPAFVEGQTVTVTNTGVLGRVTGKVSRFTDASLLEMMIGMHPEGYREDMVKDLIFLQNKGYITRDMMGEYKPTESGRALAYIIRDMEIADPEMPKYLESKIQALLDGHLSVESYKHLLQQNVIDISKELLSCGKLFRPSETDTCCPKCGNGVMRVFGKIAKCNNPDCGHHIFRQIQGVTLSGREIRNLMADGSTSAIRGFIGSDGKPFTGRVRLDDYFNPIVVNIQKN